jgi:hypothetical protein
VGERARQEQARQTPKRQRMLPKSVLPDDLKLGSSETAHPQPNVGLMADTVNTPADVDRLLTLHGCPPVPPARAHNAWLAMRTNVP